jgi:hypothetical protein
VTPLRVGPLLARVALLGFLGWLYGGDLSRWVEAQSAEVAVLSELPRLWLCLAGVAVAAGGAVVLAMAVATKKPSGWPPLRLLTIAAVSLLFFDFVVLSSRRSPISTEDRMLLAIHSLAEGATEAAASEAVPRDPTMLASFLEGLGPLPFFVNGERVASWKVELRERCAGPATEPGQLPVGTLIYCVAVDRKQAWVTLVGVPYGQVFGPRAIVSVKQGWVGEVHVPPPEPAASPDSPGESVWEQPTPDDAP